MQQAKKMLIIQEDYTGGYKEKLLEKLKGDERFSRLKEYDTDLFFFPSITKVDSAPNFDGEVFGWARGGDLKIQFGPGEKIIRVEGTDQDFEVLLPIFEIPKGAWGNLLNEQKVHRKE